MKLQVVILAAGLGTRLGRPHPKPLTYLVDGRTILQQQLDCLATAFGTDMRISIVVGHKYNLIMEHAPDAAFVYNHEFHQTNTSKSLLKALRMTAEGGVLWLNGDVVFDPKILDLLKPHIAADSSALAVNTARVSLEEMKYTLSGSGHIERLSKEVPPSVANGESIGINFVGRRDKEFLIQRLAQVDAQDYYERAIEETIGKDGIKYSPINVDDCLAVEIDCNEDLKNANRLLRPFRIENSSLLNQ